MENKKYLDKVVDHCKIIFGLTDEVQYVFERWVGVRKRI